MVAHRQYDKQQHDPQQQTNKRQRTQQDTDAAEPQGASSSSSSGSNPAPKRSAVGAEGEELGAPHKFKKHIYTSNIKRKKYKQIGCVSVRMIEANTINQANLH